jgi:hypothetical protein
MTDERSTRAGSTERAHHAGDGEPAAPRQRRMSAQRKQEAVLRVLRGEELGRKAWLFAGSDRGGQRAAAIYTLIATAKLNDVDPLAWLADVLDRIADTPASRLDDQLPWNWAAARKKPQAA